MTFIKLKENYFSIEDADNTHYKAFPVGGGFALNIPKGTEGITLVDSLPNTIEETEFYLECDNITFKGVHNPHQRWNGWACPRFSRKVFEEEIVPWINQTTEFNGFYTVKKTLSGGWEFVEKFDESNSKNWEINEIDFDEDDFTYFTSFNWCWQAK